jgi:hypothetical protein
LKATGSPEVPFKLCLYEIIFFYLQLFWVLRNKTRYFKICELPLKISVLSSNPSPLLAPNVRIRWYSVKVTKRAGVCLGEERVFVLVRCIDLTLFLTMKLFL